jgi:hypothetical protein
VHQEVQRSRISQTLPRENRIVYVLGPLRALALEINLSRAQSLAYALYPSLRSDTPIVADTLATDSFQNVLFSLLLFCTKTGRAPERMTIVSHAFKQSRFIYLHCHALRYPASRVTYIGIDPPQDEERTRAIEAGNVKVLRGWSADRFGRGEDLTGKRVKRGWDDKCLLGPDFEGWKGDLARWSGGDSKNDDFPAKLPWE